VASRLLRTRQGIDPLVGWSDEVIVPSRGVAEAIAGELLARAPNGVAGLRMQTLEELAQRILAMHGQTPRLASDIERRLAMRMAVRSVEHPMMDGRGVASMLERAYRDVRDSGVTLSELSSRAATHRRNLRNAARTEAIIRAWSEYEKTIAGLQAIDGADRFAIASRLVGSAAKPGLTPRSAEEPDVNYLVAGFYDMTGAQRQLLESLLRSDRVAAMWIPTEMPFAQTFVRAITPFVEVAREPVVASPRAQLTATQYDTRLSELRDVCARAAELLANGTPAREIGIVARSLEPYDQRLLQRFAHEHGFATTMTDEIPLSAHRIGRGALTLLRLRERGFLRGEVLELVRDGLHVKTQLDVDEADAATRRARIAGGTSEELRRMRGRSRVESYIALVAELEALTESIDLSRLGSMFKIETQQDLDAAESLDEIAAVFRRLGGLKPAAPQDVIDAIEQASLTPVSLNHQPPTANNQLTNVSRQPPTANRQPIVWCGELLRFRGRSFKHLFVVRMQDDVFPQRRTEDPLLPDSDRRLLRVREIGDGRDEEALLFSLLESAAPNVQFTYAAGDGFGKVLRASRFLRGVPRSLLPVARTPARQQATGNRQLQLLALSGTRSPFDGHLGPLQRELASLSPTQLEEFGECPQKFLLKHLLGVTDIDHPERELQINARDKGIFDHRILERFYRDLPEDELARAAASLPKLPDDVTQRLDQLVDDQFHELEREVPPFNRAIREIERRATKRLLREFLAHDLADLAAQGLVPRWFEYRFGAKHRERADHPEPFVIEAAGVPVRVEGTIDRIDADDQGRFRIVDYKSGKALRHVNLGEKIDRGVRLQLALYAMAVAEFFGVDAEHVSATIKPLVIGDAKPEKFAFALREKQDALMETLQIFIGAILRGEFPAFPNETDDFNSCKYCPVNHSCRTKHDMDERYAVQQHRDPRTLLRNAAVPPAEQAASTPPGNRE
jgi:RecB family exonuclease